MISFIASYGLWIVVIVIAWLVFRYIGKKKDKRNTKACCIDPSTPCECNNGEDCKYDICVPDN